MGDARLLTVASAGPEDLLGDSAHWSNARVLERCPALSREWTADEVAIRYGVQSRQWTVGSNINECDIAVAAARRVLGQASLPPKDIDLLITATSTPSTPTQSLAGRLAKQLDLRSEAFDVRAGGAAGIVALRLAEQSLSPKCKTALVVVAENISPWLDLNAGGVANILFADGAAALILRYEPGAGGLLEYQASTAALPGKPFTVPGLLPPRFTGEESAYAFQANDREFALAISGYRKEVCAALASAHQDNFSADGPIGAYFPMAPSRKSHEEQTRALGLDMGHSHTCLRSWGCPGGAAPFIALAQTRLPVQSVLAFTAVGGGAHAAAMTWFVDKELL